MAVSLRDSLHQVSDPRNLDARERVFALMLGVKCWREAGPVALESESLTAVVGFGGQLSGACIVSSGSGAAMQIAAHLTGSVFSEIDDTVRDGMGELCNMLAGTWKGMTLDLAARCGLSIPAVITGRDYNLHVPAAEFRLDHYYRFEDSVFAVTLICSGLNLQ